VSRGGGYGMSAFVVVIAVLQAGSLFGPPSPSDKVPAIMGLVLYFALTAMAYWLEKKRQARL
jgi:predicted PurR-regulated permease PerM